MKLVNIKTRTGISSVWSMSHSVKIIGALALGAVLLTAAIGVPGSLLDAEAVESVTPKVERVNGFLSQGQAGYSLDEQMEISGADATPVSPKVERVNGFLSQGQAGYSLEEQMEISGADTNPRRPILRTSAATSSGSGLDRATIATSAPAAAYARAMPRPPPVTMAAFPSSCISPFPCQFLGSISRPANPLF